MKGYKAGIGRQATWQFPFTIDIFFPLIHRKSTSLIIALTLIKVCKIQWVLPVQSEATPNCGLSWRYLLV